MDAGGFETSPRDTEESMKNLKKIASMLSLAVMGLAVCFHLAPIRGVQAAKGPEEPAAQSAEYRVLDPIESGAVTLYPIARIAAESHAADWRYITLDEGLQSGKVVITEAGKAAGLARNRRQRDGVGEDAGAYDSVNTLVLVNNSAHPLVLLAGEIVTGGRQDRIIAKDRIVMPHSAPLDLSVFCIEPHRWTELSDKFGSAGAVAHHSMIVEPSVRLQAMDAQNQQEVWNAVNKSVAAAHPAMAMRSTTRIGGSDVHGSGSQDAGSGGSYAEPAATSSYARAMAEPGQQQEIDKVAAPALVNDSAMPERLRKQNVVGIVAAINGHILWADLFATPELLQAYWGKLVRSYAAESLHDSEALGPAASREEALKFIVTVVKGEETSEGSAGIYRYFEVQGTRDSEFTLQVTLPGTGFDLHRARMVHEKSEKQGTLYRDTIPGYRLRPRPGVIY